MAVCEDCAREMLDADSCTVDGVILRGRRYARHRVGRPIGPHGRCADCGVTAGGYHHFGCDLEDCPGCGRQQISCGCAMLDDDTECLVLLVGDTVVHPAAPEVRRALSDPHRWN